MGKKIETGEWGGCPPDALYLMYVDFLEHLFLHFHAVMFSSQFPFYY